MEPLPGAQPRFTKAELARHIREPHTVNGRTVQQISALKELLRWSREDLENAHQAMHADEVPQRPLLARVRTDGVRAVIIPVSGPITAATAPDDGDAQYRWLRGKVGGPIQIVNIPRPAEPAHLYVHESGLLERLPLNRRASLLCGIAVVGDAVVFGSGADDLEHDVPEDLVELLGFAGGVS